MSIRILEIHDCGECPNWEEPHGLHRHKGVLGGTCLASLGPVTDWEFDLHRDKFMSCCPLDTAPHVTISPDLTKADIAELAESIVHEPSGEPPRVFK